MTKQPKFAAGDTIHVAIACEWIEGKILDHFHWQDQSGNSCLTYHVDIGTGVICCGENSIVEVTDPECICETCKKPFVPVAAGSDACSACLTDFVERQFLSKESQ